MPDGGQVIISGRQEALGEDNALGLPPGAYACLTVTDTGAGMDEATLAHAIEPFFTTKGVGKGTGLGLPMVHGLAEQSGGRLRMTSRMGEGTTVEVWLPAAVGMTGAHGHDVIRVDPSEPAGRRLRILAVDDDDLVLMNTGAMLEDLGHAVIEAHSGAEALQVLKRDPAIDLLITDQAMPNMTGLQLAEQARRLHPDLATILATGYAELPPDIDPTMARLAKPFTQAELAAAVGLVLDGEPV